MPSTNPPLSSSLLSISLVSASGEVLLLWEISSFSPSNSPVRVTSVTMATTTDPSLGYPYHWKTAPQACNSITVLPEDGFMLFVFLWRMVARTRALPDQVRWRLLRSSLNHAPVRERRRDGSVSVCSRILQRCNRAKLKQQIITTSCQQKSADSTLHHKLNTHLLVTSVIQLTQLMKTKVQ